MRPWRQCYASQQSVLVLVLHWLHRPRVHTRTHTHVPLITFLSLLCLLSSLELLPSMNALSLLLSSHFPSCMSRPPRSRLHLFFFPLLPAASGPAGDSPRMQYRNLGDFRVIYNFLSKSKRIKYVFSGGNPCRIPLLSFLRRKKRGEKPEIFEKETYFSSCPSPSSCLSLGEKQIGKSTETEKNPPTFLPSPTSAAVPRLSQHKKEETKGRLSSLPPPKKKVLMQLSASRSLFVILLSHRESVKAAFPKLSRAYTSGIFFALFKGKRFGKRWCELCDRNFVWNGMRENYMHVV